VTKNRPPDLTAYPTSDTYVAQTVAFFLLSTVNRCYYSLVGACKLWASNSSALRQ